MVPYSLEELTHKMVRLNLLKNEAESWVLGV